MLSNQYFVRGQFWVDNFDVVQRIFNNLAYYTVYITKFGYEYYYYYYVIIITLLIIKLSISFAKLLIVLSREVLMKERSTAL